MKPEYTDELDADMPSRKSGTNSCLVIAIVVIAATVVVLGLLSAVAIPAFVKYLEKSKASEAPAMLAQLEYRAIQYYQDSGADGTCQFPPSANPLPPGEACCDDVGPRNGDTWTPTPETWSQEGWSALAFSASDPTYFAYQTINTTAPDGTERLELRAFTDFKPGGPRHTYSISIEGRQNDQGECIASSLSPVLTNAFE